jgi:hypothetical protein
MKRILGLVVALVALASTSGASAASWSASVPFTTAVASTPFEAGGYPVPPGATAPEPGTCRLGMYNANRSESWLAVNPGTEDLVGVSKVFFEKFSTFYDFHNGSYTIENGVPAGNNIIQGYECVSTGTQQMPPSWMNNTDPTVEFDTQGRAYSLTLPFNPWWVNRIHPDAAVGISYSDDLGRNWTLGNGGRYLDRVPNQSSKTFGGVEDKQWLAVDRSAAGPFRDSVYAAWSVFNGLTTKIRFAYSRDRAASFSKPVTLTAPGEVGPSNTYVYPSVDAGGTVYVAFASFPSPVVGTRATLYVTRSVDGGVSWGPFVPVATTRLVPGCCLPNTTFRDGIAEHFAASQTHPGHVYMVWEDWSGTDYDVKFSQSTDGGMSWSTPLKVNDNEDDENEPTDQFQPQVASGPNGAVAVNFYDRRESCPADPSVLTEDVGEVNFCIDVSLQAFKDAGAGAVRVGANLRISEFTWDPEQPDQTIDGIDQMACSAHVDPCGLRAFIGDYFGLAISNANVYSLFVSTHYPSGVVGDGGAIVYYQQQVLATVPRSALGAGY